MLQQAYLYTFKIYTARPLIPLLGMSSLESYLHARKEHDSVGHRRQQIIVNGGVAKVLLDGSKLQIRSSAVGH